MREDPRVKVAVITATIGHPDLERTLRSVQQQTFPQLEHWLIVDGPEFEPAVRPAVQNTLQGAAPPKVTVLPYRTGMDGWCSHRIYAAAPFLVNADFVCFLDQDNWFEKDHVALLLEAALATEVPAAYSLRKIFTQQGEFVCQDDCQSLGTLHDAFDCPGARHIDTNCWILRRSLATELASHWCQPYVGDRAFARSMLARYPEISCTRAYSLNYTAGSRAESASADFFLDGNAAMQRRYPEGLPWQPRRR